MEFITPIQSVPLHSIRMEMENTINSEKADSVKFLIRMDSETGIDSLTIKAESVEKVFNIEAEYQKKENHVEVYYKSAIDGLHGIHLEMLLSDGNIFRYFTCICINKVSRDKGEICLASSGSKHIL